MSMVKLSNGSTADEALVTTIMLNLETLWNGGMDGMLAVCDLNEMCKGQGYKPFGNGFKILHDRELIDGSGRPHDSVRDVVQSAVKGVGVDIHLASPIAGTVGFALPKEVLEAMAVLERPAPAKKTTGSRRPGF